MAGMIKYLQSFRFKGLTVILGVFLAISVVLWTERSGIQYQAEIKKNAYLDRDTVVTETQAVKNIESSCLVLMDSSLRCPVQNLNCLRHDLGADSIPFQHRDAIFLHKIAPSCSRTS